MNLKFSLKCLRGFWRRHFWWQTVPCFCCSDKERSVADRGKPCQWYSQCWGRWRAQTLSTRKSSDRLQIL